MGELCRLLLRCQALSARMSWLLVVATCLLLTVRPAVAGFVLPDAVRVSHSMAWIAQDSERQPYALTRSINKALETTVRDANEDGAGSTEAAGTVEPVAPARPLNGFPSETRFAAVYAFGISGPGSTSSVRVSSGGGLSGSVGIFDSSWRLPESQSVSWLHFGEFLHLLPGPPDDVFRPPPIATLSS